MPSKQLIHRAVGDKRLCEKLSKVDVLRVLNLAPKSTLLTAKIQRANNELK